MRFLLLSDVEERRPGSAPGMGKIVDGYEHRSARNDPLSCVPPKTQAPLAVIAGVEEAFVTSILTGARQ